jgi:putative transcriptional regulator
MIEIDNLTGNFLISLENQEGNFFSKSLIWIIKHSNSGSLGLVINKPFARKVRNSTDIKTDTLKKEVQIRDFGPVDRARLFLIHRGTDDVKETDSLEIGADLFLSEYSASIFATQANPRETLVGVGYSGWGPGQLESEILANVWLLAPFDKKILFDVPDKRKLATAANSIGVDLNLLPRNIGHG